MLKTMKQFLQPMIEQVWEGGGGGRSGSAGRMCRFFCVSFSELLYFCVGFFNSDAFFGLILQISAYFFAVYYVYFIKKSNSVLGTKFS